jgi:hypothetical protein
VKRLDRTGARRSSLAPPTLRMRRIEVDPGARTAHAQGGVTLGELDGATQEHEAAVAGVHSREHREAFGRLR